MRSVKSLTPWPLPREIQGDGNTITVKADVPKDIDLSPDTDVSVIP